jgi:branched-chain amino acid transport system substrate-binding protein
VRGDSGTPQQGIASVQYLADQQGVEAFLGCYLSPVALAASDAALQADKLYWETNALAGKVTERNLPNLARSGLDVQRFAERSVSAVTGFVAKTLGKSPADLKIFIEHEDSEYGTSMYEFHARLLKQAGVRTITEGTHSVKAVDFTDAILRAQGAKPDIWMTITYVPMNNLLLRTARDQGFAPPATMLCGTGDTPETLQALGAKSLEGILVVGYPRPDQSEHYGPGAATYLAAYRKAFGGDPIAPQGMTAFVGAQMLFEAVTAAGKTDFEAVRSVLPKFDKPVGATATGYGMKFDERGQNVRAFPTVVQWQGGKLVTVFPDEAKAEGVVIKPFARS